MEGSEGGSKPVDVIFDPSPGGRGRAATDGVKMRAGKGIAGAALITTMRASYVLSDTVVSCGGLPVAAQTNNPHREIVSEIA